MSDDIVDLAKNLWAELESCSWQPVPSLGSKWLGKWFSAKKGYSLIISNGISVYGEQRNASYIEDKSQEWSSCLESEPKELSDLVLSQLEERDTELRVITQDENKLHLELTAFLDQLPYNWLFYLSKVPGEIVEHHLTLPLVTTVEFLSEKVFRLEEEVKRKNKQLEELLPPSRINSRKNNETMFNSCMETAVDNLVNKGIGNILSSHLAHSTTIMTMRRNRLKEQENKTEKSKVNPESHNRPRPKLRKLAKGVFGNECSLIRQDSGEDKRRAEIQALTQGPLPAPTKKKKLNI